MTQSFAQEARDRYAGIAEAWLSRFNVTVKKVRTGLHGCAYTESREIEVPWPATSRKRLYIIAHEIGHVALGHLRKLPRYVQEFEAEQFAHGLMRQSGVSVPRSMTERAKRYVHRKIGKAHVRGIRWIDPDIAEWAGGSAKGVNWTAEPKHVKPYHTAALRRVSSALNSSPNTKG